MKPPRCAPLTSKHSYAWIGSAVGMFGRLDSSVNCAGVSISYAYSMFPRRTCIPSHVILALYALISVNRDKSGFKATDEWDAVIDINLTGTFRCLCAQLALISPEGRVVNLTSTVGMQGLPFAAPYASRRIASVEVDALCSPSANTWTDCWAHRGRC